MYGSGGMQAMYSCEACGGQFKEVTGDFVITTEPQHFYVLRERWGLEARLVGSRDEVPAAQVEANRAGQRVMLDLDGLVELKLQAPGP